MRYIVCGKKDSINKKAARKLAEYIPTAALRIVKGAGHEVNHEMPQIPASAIREFWSESR